MKKKIFSLMAVVMFASSTINATSNVIEEKLEFSSFCEGVGLDAVESWEDSHNCLTAEEATDMYNRWYAACKIFGFN